MLGLGAAVVGLGALSLMGSAEQRPRRRRRNVRFADPVEEDAVPGRSIGREAWDRDDPRPSWSAPKSEGFFNHVPLQTNQARLLRNGGLNGAFRPSDREVALLRKTDERQTFPEEFTPPINYRRRIITRRKSKNEAAFVSRVQTEPDNAAFFGNAAHRISIGDQLRRMPDVKPDEFQHRYSSGAVLVERQTPQEAFATRPTITQLKARGMGHVSSGRREPTKVATRALYTDSMYSGGGARDAFAGERELHKKHITGPGYTAPNPGQSAAVVLPQNSRPTRKKQGEQMERYETVNPSVVAIDMGPRVAHDGLGQTKGHSRRVVQHRAPVYDPSVVQPEHTVHAMGKSMPGTNGHDLRHTKKWGEIANRRQRTFADGTASMPAYGVLPELIRATWDRTKRMPQPGNDSSMPDMAQAPASFLMTTRPKRAGGWAHRCAEVDPSAEADTLSAAMNTSRGAMSADMKWREQVLTLATAMDKVRASGAYTSQVAAPEPTFV